MNRFYCFYTSHYADYAKTCITSFASFGLEVKPIVLADGLPWMDNCMERCKWLCGAAELHPNDGIGLLDADLTCLKKPERLHRFAMYGEKIDERYPLSIGIPLDADPESVVGAFGHDLAVHDLTDIGRTPDDKCCRYSAGVICFAPTVQGRACLKVWTRRCREDALKDLERLREQVYLYEAIHSTKAKVFNLGRDYNCPLDERPEPDKTVILHHVASRQLRPVVGGSI